jgi:hypothetical protein
MGRGFVDLNDEANADSQNDDAQFITTSDADSYWQWSIRHVIQKALAKAVLSPSLEDEPRALSRSFVQHANRLVKSGQIDAALDMIYDRIDAFLVSCNFQEVDLILRDVNPQGLSVDILLGLLTCTLPARTKLSRRAAFFVLVEQEIRRRGEWEVDLLTGLES